jgi:hypothetical protein
VSDLCVVLVCHAPVDFDLQFSDHTDAHSLSTSHLFYLVNQKITFVLFGPSHTHTIFHPSSINLLSHTHAYTQTALHVLGQLAQNTGFVCTDVYTRYPRLLPTLLTLLKGEVANWVVRYE